MMRFLLLSIVFISLFIFISCEESENPNSLSGDTEIQLTEPGNEIGIFFNMEGIDNPVVNNISDSVIIKSRDNGIVTTWAHFSIDEESLLKIDTIFGTQNIDKNLKRQVLDIYLDRFGAEIDTSDKENMWLEAEWTLKVTSKGIQDFTYSGNDLNKPFTIVKYNAKVGDKYTFKTEDGSEITREVVRKSKDDDFELGFILVKVIEVEETRDDPMIDKITYYANHKLGLVGIKADLKNGNEGMMKLYPWAVLNVWQ